GALGQHVARRLVEHGARHLVLTSRSGLPERASWQAEHPEPVRARIAAVQALEAAGAQVTLARADAASEEQMTALLDRLDDPLRGVVHTAGSLDDGLLVGLQRARLAAVLAPKVAGAWLLHQLTRSRPLDFFVLFSSTASVLGSAGQGSYAAANGFLDALALHRRRAELPALSISWGPWAEAGMTDSLDQAHQRRMLAHGLVPMAPALALDAMEHALSGAQGHAMIAAI
ncbi:MAG: KR domain-containing protein, partial [Delftia sp.]|nr:KR domain-containing protein [Delftia sp.]